MSYSAPGSAPPGRLSSWLQWLEAGQRGRREIGEGSGATSSTSSRTPHGDRSREWLSKECWAGLCHGLSGSG